MVRRSLLRRIRSCRPLTWALAAISVSAYPCAGSAHVPGRAIEPHIGPYPGSDLERLESRPEADKAIYLDISEVMDGDTPLTMSKADMWRMWQCVASSLSMFEINVTTDPAAYARAGVSNAAVLRFVNQDGRSNGPIDSFGTTKASTIYRHADGPEVLGIVVAQLTAQHFGLRGDGGPDTVSTEHNWAPLLLTFPEAVDRNEDSLFQWSKGECGACGNDQDDLAIIHNYAEYRADDYPEPVALKVSAAGLVSAEENRGQIGVGDDGDAFKFEIGAAGGEVDLLIERTEVPCGGMLDIHADLLDSDGNLLLSENPEGLRWARIDASLNEGPHTLIIRAGAEGTPTSGFSTYSSLGFYSIEGEINEFQTDDDAGEAEDTGDDSGDGSDEDTGTSEATAGSDGESDSTDTSGTGTDSGQSSDTDGAGSDTGNDDPGQSTEGDGELGDTGATTDAGIDEGAEEGCGCRQTHGSPHRVSLWRALFF